jgi:transcriptional regulator with XRE-family HTH domain
MAIGETIKSLRQQRGWSARELGRQAGVSANTVARAEQDKPIHLEGLAKIAQALGVTVSTLLGDGGNLGGMALVPRAEWEEAQRVRAALDALGDLFAARVKRSWENEIPAELLSIGFEADEDDIADFDLGGATALPYAVERVSASSGATLNIVGSPPKPH